MSDKSGVRGRGLGNASVVGMNSHGVVQLWGNQRRRMSILRRKRIGICTLLRFLGAYKLLLIFILCESHKKRVLSTSGHQ